LAPRLPVLAVVVAVAALAGCGTTEKSGSVGDTLTAKGIEVTVERVDQSVPVPASDVTGLSSPSPGSKLVGVLAKACSNHGGAIGSFDFGLDPDSGSATQKYVEHNYPNAFDVVRTGCGSGWMVFEIPKAGSPQRVTFGFQDTGSALPSGGANQVNAKFSWDVGGD
jgi:hypothetical protein